MSPAVLCESESTLTGAPCQSQGRWVGPDGKVRCSMHQIQEFGHGSPLVKNPDYEVPVNAPEPPVAP